MTIGIAAFLTFRQANYSTVVSKHQNYWPNHAVDGATFYPFAVDSIIANSSGGQDSIAVTFAISSTIADTIESGIAQSYLIELIFYKFSPTTSGAPPTAKTQFATFIGEIISATQSESGITMQVGSNLNAVEAQAPPRKFTTELIGSPPKI